MALPSILDDDDESSWLDEPSPESYQGETNYSSAAIFTEMIPEYREGYAALWPDLYGLAVESGRQKALDFIKCTYRSWPLVDGRPARMAHRLNHFSRVVEFYLD